MISTPSAGPPDVKAPAAEASRPAVVGAASFDPDACSLDLMRSSVTTLRVAHSSAIQVHSSSSDIPNHHQ